MNIYLKVLFGTLKANPKLLLTTLKGLVAYLEANPAAEGELIAEIEKLTAPPARAAKR